MCHQDSHRAQKSRRPTPHTGRADGSLRLFPSHLPIPPVDMPKKSMIPHYSRIVPPETSVARSFVRGAAGAM